MASKVSGTFDGFQSRGGDEYQQVSAPRDGGKSPSAGAGDAVESADKSTAPREFSKGAGSGANAIEAGDKGVMPREFPKGGWYKPESPCENLLNKEEKIISGKD